MTPFAVNSFILSFPHVTQIIELLLSKQAIDQLAKHFVRIEIFYRKSFFFRLCDHPASFHTETNDYTNQKKNTFGATRPLRARTTVRQTTIK